MRSLTLGIHRRVIAAAGFAYLRSNNTPTTGGVPATNPLAVGLNPVRYAFVTPSLGWAVINPFTPSSSVGQFRVFRTVDGAKHWELQLTGQSSSPGFTPITVHFFDKTHGYMAVDLAFMGEQVYRTSTAATIGKLSSCRPLRRLSSCSAMRAMAGPWPRANRLPGSFSISMQPVTAV
jgi:hypothetical protein